MRIYFLTVGMLVVMLTLVFQAGAFDLVKVDASQTLAPWWIHIQDYGKPIKQVWQLYGILEYDWFAFTTGPVFRVPATQIDCQIPIGLRISVADAKVPVTHYVAKVNFMGKIGPLKLAAIHDMAWGRRENKNVLFVQEALSWRSIGVQIEGLKVGDKPLPAYLGPVVSYSFTPQHQIQVFLGVNLRNTEQRSLRITYSFIKF